MNYRIFSIVVFLSLYIINCSYDGVDNYDQQGIPLLEINDKHTKGHYLWPHSEAEQIYYLDSNVAANRNLRLEGFADYKGNFNYGHCYTLGYYPNDVIGTNTWVSLKSNYFGAGFTTINFSAYIDNIEGITFLSENENSGITWSMPSVEERYGSINCAVNFQSTNSGYYTTSVQPIISTRVQGATRTHNSRKIDFAVYDEKRIQNLRVLSESASGAGRLSDNVLTDLYYGLNDIYRQAVISVAPFSHNYRRAEFLYDQHETVNGVKNLGFNTGHLEVFYNTENSTQRYNPEIDALLNEILQSFAVQSDPVIFITHSDLRFAFRLGEDYIHNDETPSGLPGHIGGNLPNNRVVKFNENPKPIFNELYREIRNDIDITNISGDKRNLGRWIKGEYGTCVLSHNGVYYLELESGLDYSEFGATFLKDDSYIYVDNIMSGFNIKGTNITVVRGLLARNEGNYRSFARTVAHELLHTNVVGNNLKDLYDYQSHRNNLMYHIDRQGNNVKLYKTQWDTIHNRHLFQN